MPRLKDQAICIRHLDWSETSQVVVLLTAEHGKVRGLAKGSKRMSPSSVARFSGGLELLTLGQIVAMVRPTSELANLTEWDLQQDYHRLRTDLPRQRLGLYGADLCHAMLADHDPHPGAFAAMKRLLDELVGDVVKPQPALLRFQWDLLRDTGYAPELDADVATGETLDSAKAYTFDPRAGGLTARNGLEDWRVRHATVALLRDASRGSDLNANDHASLSRANRLLCVYARSILDKELPTMGFVLRGTGARDQGSEGGG